MRGEDLTGQTFSRYTALSLETPLPTTRGNRWLCRCECGNEKVVSAKSLKAGDAKSCGCLTSPNLTSKTFNRLTVTGEDTGRKGGRRFWFCQCSCGVSLPKSVASYDLTSGHTKSCGCMQKELARKANTKHGLKQHPLYVRWSAMKNRCYNPNDDYYHNYGGRGIKVCDRWRNSVDNFLEDMGMPPEGYTLDRKDNDGDYSPENCRWSTPKEQGRNKSDTVWVEYRGERVKRIELAERFGVEPKVLHQRLHVQGWSLERSLDPPRVYGRGTGMLAGLNVKTRGIVFGKKVSGLARVCGLDPKVLVEGTTYYSLIDDTWLAKSIEDETPWSEFKASNVRTDDVIYKPSDGTDIIFSNVREAYRHLERHSLLDKEYTLKVFE